MEARNANYAHIASTLSFRKRQWLDFDGEPPRDASPLKVIISEHRHDGAVPALTSWRNSLPAQHGRK